MRPVAFARTMTRLAAAGDTAALAARLAPICPRAGLAFRPASRPMSGRAEATVARAVASRLVRYGCLHQGVPAVRILSFRYRPGRGGAAIQHRR
jgi:hypothetical protein